MNAQLVVAHQLQGVMLHHDLMLAFAVLGKHYNCREQRRHMYHEMMNMDKTQFAVIKQTGAAVDTGPLTKIKITDVNANMTDEQKKTACQALKSEWRKWETATVEFYRAQIASDPDNKWLKYLMKEAEAEVRHLDKMV